MPELAKIEAQKVEAKSRYESEIENVVARRTDLETTLVKQSTDEQIKEAENLAKLIDHVNDQIAKRDEQTMEHRRTEVERELDQQERLYEQCSDRVTSKVADIFSGLLHGTISLLDTFKELFLNTVAQIAAELITRPIIVPIIGSVIGGLAGAVSPAVGGAVLAATGLAGADGGGGGAAGTALERAGIASLFPIGSIGNFLAQPIGRYLPADWANALGLAATLSYLLPTLIPAMIGPVGLALSALLPIIGGSLFKPSGPRLQLVGPTEQALDEALQTVLQVNSASAKNLQRDVTAQLQAIPVQISSGLLNPLNLAFGQLANAPFATQLQRLPAATAGLAQTSQTVLTAIRNLEETGQSDVQHIVPQLYARLEQFRLNLFQTLQEDMGRVLGQASAAFGVETQRTLTQQVTRLPRAINAMLQNLQLFEQVITQAAQLGESEQLNRLRQTLNTFRERVGQQLISDFQRLLSQATLGQFGQVLGLAAALPQEVTALDPRIAQLTATAQAFLPVVSTIDQAITGLQDTLTPLPDQLAAASTNLADLGQQIAEAGNDYQTALPPFQAYAAGLQKETQLRIQQAQEQDKQRQQQIQDLRSQVNDVQQLEKTYQSLTTRIRQLIQGTQAPALTRQQLESQIADLQAQLPGLTGQPQADALTQLVDLNQPLLELGKSTSQLDVQQEAVQNLTVLEQMVTQQLTTAQAQLNALQTQTDVEAQIRDIQAQELAHIQ